MTSVFIYKYPLWNFFWLEDYFLIASLWVLSHSDSTRLTTSVFIYKFPFWNFFWLEDYFLRASLCVLSHCDSTWLTTNVLIYKFREQSLLSVFYISQRINKAYCQRVSLQIFPLPFFWLKGYILIASMWVLSHSESTRITASVFIYKFSLCHSSDSKVTFW